ncbi:UDP-glucose 4-epimerase GalE [Microbacterium sp. zg.B48]|uniref:UDP-glucose 4-epimerase GalE n=1 Tax=Microbacterium sp. zg.B48 TaxID=2969408 RepID=UPI00214B99B5|nr:UDP-glucose 4-epimerase GalE [Microbacterium sp. zg.B48]MCR2764625.1 UDP-glucose 4-epimerase GalE [Microbacterium sp. zg.B48]
MKVLITGGAGFIGSTVASACMDAGIIPVILDDLSTGREAFTRGRLFYRGDIADASLLDQIAADHPDLSFAIHCAAKVVVPDSVIDPLGYYDTNVAKTIELLRGLQRNGIGKVIFSSSASVYDAEDGGAVTEEGPIQPASPYARTKAMVEQILADSAGAGDLRAIALRYFNPIGADPQSRSGLPQRDPSHVLGLLISAHRHGGTFTITGTDWPTRDGSGLRDFIHVWDLARAHVQAVRRFDLVTEKAAFRAVNVGGGTGTTIRELVAAFERVTGASVDVRIGPRRAGDVAGAYADVQRAADLLGWRAELTIDEGIRDSLAWAESFDSASGH